MEYEDILFTRKDNVARITINRPDSGNMFRAKTMVEIRRALESTREDEDTRVVVISGAGGKFFCIGGEKVEGVESYYTKELSSYTKELSSGAGGKFFCI